ncbi:GNAT family N-acetyltransferase [Steroidobacter sp. S1-65]|uniref:GNAT family N-acetyltransferase n=1 Tax=Steroidobacter gossypii TaxID=2805490 RepID=A0ABS1WZ00_9GAMM|nr:GNAT family N-acetyltransferase [Steroidobacter gossypii]MBM0106200.1 GNAT family N-acetyltransferase [Steroidobacter gossypii]
MRARAFLHPATQAPADSSAATGTVVARDADNSSATGRISIQLIERRADIPLTAAAWNAVVARNETNSIFQTYEWFDAWWQTFGAAHQLFFLLLRADNRIIGFAALMLRRRLLGGTRLEFVGTGNADYQDVVVLPGHKGAAMIAICDFLHAHAGRWRSAWLCNVPTQSSTLNYLRSLGAGHELYLVDEAVLRCPSLQLQSEQHEAERLLKKYSMKRPLNWFAARGEVQFRHLSSPAEIQRQLPVFFDQHARRYRAAGRASLFESASQRAFYTKLASTMQTSGWLLFSVVEFNGQPIAFHFGFDYSGSITWYKPSFEVRYAEHSPGLLLTRKLIEDGIARARREVDFTIGDEPFKDRFANMSRFNETLRVYHSRPNAWRARVWRWLRRTMSRARRGVRGLSSLTVSTAR